ncbi:hypothetical protein [Stenotrophobium rhamnosiphilum]|uniref:Uncharacterized protein n=1 Tax=Stenotrophobium rhamnosiphilum TaxID=2029166 RepID=A0A2T5MBF6_9GAMM|nr:hypothetical protein [Stenotrophobium rhamnosiphilum]PTU29062.1 hypothetical protein CJD38_17025 [Stenotrophobium rhamnosiphilum]
MSRWSRPLSGLALFSAALSIAAAIFGDLTIEGLAAYLLINVYSYIQLRQFLLDKNMIAGMGSTMRADNREDTLVRKAYAAMFIAALAAQIAFSIASLIK